MYTVNKLRLYNRRANLAVGSGYRKRTNMAAMGTKRPDSSRNQKYTSKFYTRLIVYLIHVFSYLPYFSF